VKRSHTYRNTRFSAETLDQACEVFLKVAKVGIKADALRVSYEVPDDWITTRYHRLVWVGDDEWTHDTQPEFDADYRKGGRFNLNLVPEVMAGNSTDLGYRLEVSAMDSPNVVNVSVSASSRHSIQEVFGIFDAAQSTSHVRSRGERFRQSHYTINVVGGLVVILIVAVASFIIGKLA
jgi:hypothetical protein